MHTWRYLCIERAFFFFFFPSDDAVPILDLVSPGASPKPSFVPTPIRAFSGRGKFRPTSSQPLYSTVLQLAFERTLQLTEEDTRYFGGSRVVREFLVNGNRFHANHQGMMWKSISLFFTLRFRGFGCIDILESGMICELKMKELFPSFISKCKWELISRVQML